MSAKPIPDGFHTITPYLMVEGAGGFLAFLEKAFGATITERVLAPDGKVGHAQARIGDSHLMIGEATAQWKAAEASLYLYVADADATYESALAAGALGVMAPTDMFYGDRNGGVKDSWGITWWIATHIEDVSPEELQKRATAAMQKRRA